MGTPGLSDDRDGHAAVVLVDCAGGDELKLVHKLLVSAFGTPAVLIRGADLSTRAISLDPDRGLLEVDGVRFRPEVGWIRHCSTGAIFARARAHGVSALLEAETWSRFFRQLSGLTGTTIPGAAPTGTSQLSAAERMGIEVPESVMTNCVRTAAEQMGSRRQLMVKNPDFRLFEPDPANWPDCLPTVLDVDDVLRSRPAIGPPVVVQEYVPHLRELRIYHLDGGLCAFEVRTQHPAQMWTDPAAVTVTRVECPPAAAAAVRLMSATWGLRFGAFDLLVRSSGEPVFLEVNPDGDWLWYERRAGWRGVSFMAAVMVHELFVRAGERVAG
ncbi:hypothetical protein ACWKSP_08865 [Micromonosporaceae bacterium Da 78-11]